MTLSALEPGFWTAFCRAVDREGLLGEQFAPAVPGERAYDELCALFQSRTRQEWLEIIDEADACCEPVYTVEEALASAPVQALEMLTGEGLLPPVRLSAHQVSVESTPVLGQHTAALLEELGYEPREVEGFKEQGVI
jgi:crotonobetainyl-CoA:carnitine CoA-transferase CaiB-like acyl-CoA transferase